MKIALHLLIVIYIWYLATLSRASYPNQVQDFCVAVIDPTPSVFVNGKICKNPNNDFFFSGLNKPGNTTSNLSGGTKAIPVTVDELPGLNTQGVSMVSVDYEPYGLDTPHTHPRASEMIVVLEGTIYVGFVTSTDSADLIQENKLFTKTLYPGDVFVFPQGLIHFQLNIGNTNAVSLSSLNSQNQGITRIPNALFASNPRIKTDVLAKTFQVKKNMIRYLQAQRWPDNV